MERSWRRVGELEEIEWRDSWRVFVKSQCEVVSGLTPDTTCRERLNPRPTQVRMSVNTKMEHRTLARALVITGTRVHLSESVSRKDSDHERKMF